MISLILSPFRVSKGVRIFISNETQQKVLGAFSDLNNHDNGMFATGHIPGDLLAVEIQVPPYVSDPGEFTISGIGCDFKPGSNLKQTTDEWYGASGSCNADISCFPLPEYQRVKDAVVRIVYLGDERCTGTLVNNTLNDGRNYVLTAGHCIETEAVANSAVFYFGYESPYCDGPDGSSERSVSGATLRARGGDLDFALLELIEPPPFTYHPYYAGWDRSVVPPASGYSIHHPLGDVKKISLDEDPITVSTFTGLFNPQTHWKISRWATGTTEAGSSGAGLFDSQNRLRGTLTGGEASCSYSVNDYFQMFSHSWQDYPDSDQQLAWWLDPLHSATTFTGGYDPYAAFRESGDTLSNIQGNEAVGMVSAGLDWGSWSGHNSGHYTQFAEHFTATGKIQGVLLDVAQNHVASASSVMVVKIWSAKGRPEETLIEKEVPLTDLLAGHTSFIAFDSAVTVADSFFAGYTLFYGSPPDTFALSMASERTISGISTAWLFDGTWRTLAAASNGDVISSYAISPLIYDSLPPVIPPPVFPEPVRIYPNPAQSVCRIEFNALNPGEVHISVFDLQGDLVETYSYGAYQRIFTIDTSGYRSGVYVVRISQGSKLYREKLVIIR
jgi:hypothetical protein